MNKNVATTLILLVFIFGCNQKQNIRSGKGESKPNIIVILTDDQGIGDFGFNGNPYIKTPNLDRLASQSTYLTNFYVSPVCAPTRSSLMTGKFYERTGIYDTYNGGAIMAPEEITIAEILKKYGFSTGIFGKWHLGDNYPGRPIDQGFDESLIFKSGGMGQPGDIFNFRAKDSSYFNPVLFHNEKPEQETGYCSDIFTSKAIDFIKKNKKSPFFLYLAYNAPHTPLQLPGEYYDMYKDLSFDPDSFAVFDEAVGKMSSREMESAKRVYGMVTNIDDNVGKLMQTLNDEGIADNTLLIFLSDNGPRQNRYKMGLRDRKGSVYEGGVRVPCLIRYPSEFKAGDKIDIPLAHIDLLPTILDVCGIKDLAEKNMDGRSFLPAVKNGNDGYFKSRLFYEEWIRGFPVRYRNTSVKQGIYKLVGHNGYSDPVSQFELYNIAADPGEKENLVSAEPDIASELKEKLANWYNELTNESNYRNIQYIYLGSPHENPVYLNRNDAKGEPVWLQEDIYAYWDVKVVSEGKYNIMAEFLNEINIPGQLHVKMYPMNFIQSVNNQPCQKIKMNNIELAKGDYRFEVAFEASGGKRFFPFYVSVKKQ